MEKTIGAAFMEASACKNCGLSGREKKLPPPSAELPYDENTLLLLPEPDMMEDRQVNFLELVELRTSVRDYHGTPLTLKDLSYLLWCTQGVKMALPTGASLRNVPSAGARHALETYIYIRQVEGLAPGLYRFIALRHALAPVNLTESIAEKLPEAFMGQRPSVTCAALFIWSAVLERMAYAYEQRAYRYLHLDAGHVCQNLYLAAQTINFGACAIGHFDDDKLNEMLEADGQQQFAVYAAAVGK